MNRLLARFAPRPSTPSTAAGASVTRPALSPGVRSTGDARSLDALRRFETAVMPEVVLRGTLDPVHGGSDDLLTWPPSPVELDLTDRWLDSCDPRIAGELYLVAGSQDRACAIGELVYIRRRSAAADVLLARAFGTEPVR